MITAAIRVDKDSLVVVAIHCTRKFNGNFQHVDIVIPCSGLMVHQVV